MRESFEISEKKITEFVGNISQILDANQISSDKATRIVHRTSHGPDSLFYEDLNSITPAIVLRPNSTKEVSEVVKVANKFKIPIVVQGGRTGSYGAEAIRDCIVIDLANMNKVINFEPKNHRITAEAGIRIKDYNEYLGQRGYMSIEYPTLAWSSTLGARIGVSGYNKFEHTWGGSAVATKGIEVVLPNGDIVKLGRGSRVPAKNVTGFDLMSLFIGSRGTFGVVTAVTQSFIEIPSKFVYGIWAFKRMEDATSAYLELLSTKYRGAMWRAKTYHKMRIGLGLEVTEGAHWPEDVEMVADYNIYGEPEVADAMEKACINIMKKHNGFWREDIPDTTSFGKKRHENAAKTMAMCSLYSKRNEDGGMAYKMVPLDPIIPHSTLVESARPIIKQLMKVEDKRSYPALAGKLFVYDPGSAIPGDIGYNKVFINLIANSKTWDDAARREFNEWFMEFAELIWSYGGALTGTHGFMPREIQDKILRRELGDNEYELARKLKSAIDPNNIMNPKIRF